jgi:predicted nucleic acid-binding protein
LIGLTLDTGALIAIERRHATMASVFALATKHERKITVPTPVLIEWWRGSSRIREDILASVDIDPLDDALAKLAGEAIAAIRGATAVDAAVMASAARRGDVVYTSDVGDLTRLRAFFPNVRIVMA